MGRICALLAYCYRLCRHYIVQESLPASTLLVLLASMGGCLVAFFTEVGFYAWLQEQGGWVSWVRRGPRGLKKKGGGGGGPRGAKGRRGAKRG